MKKPNLFKIIQENILLKARILLKGGHFSQFKEIPPKIENEFLKQVLAFEEAEPQPLYQVLGISPDAYPPPEQLTEKELQEKYQDLMMQLESHQISVDLKEGLPLRKIYQYLVEELQEKFTIIPGMELHLDGCSGWCPDCFQVDYCDAKDDFWTREELERERNKKKEKK